MNNTIIKIENLSAGYEKKTVLHNINLEISEKDFLGIIGPNGGGKTTLMKVILDGTGRTGKQTYRTVERRTDAKSLTRQGHSIKSKGNNP